MILGGKKHPVETAESLLHKGRGDFKRIMEGPYNPRRDRTRLIDDRSMIIRVDLLVGEAIVRLQPANLRLEDLPVARLGECKARYERQHYRECDPPNHRQPPFSEFYDVTSEAV